MPARAPAGDVQHRLRGLSSLRRSSHRLHAVRVHSQNQGWLGWAHDGADAGTTGLYKRGEALEVQILPKGQVPAGYDASKAAAISR